MRFSKRPEKYFFYRKTLYVCGINWPFLKSVFKGLNKKKLLKLEYFFEFHCNIITVYTFFSKYYIICISKYVTCGITIHDDLKDG